MISWKITTVHLSTGAFLRLIDLIQDNPSRLLFRMRNIFFPSSLWTSESSQRSMDYLQAGLLCFYKCGSWFQQFSWLWNTSLSPFKKKKKHRKTRPPPPNVTLGMYLFTRIFLMALDLWVTSGMLSSLLLFTSLNHDHLIVKELARSPTALGWVRKRAPSADSADLQGRSVCWVCSASPFLQGTVYFYLAGSARWWEHHTLRGGIPTAISHCAFGEGCRGHPRFPIFLGLARLLKDRVGWNYF